MTSWPGRNRAATCSAATMTKEMSGSFDFRSGVGAPSEHDDLDRVDHDGEVEPDRRVLDVIEVVTHLLDLFLEAVRVAVPDLCPPGDAGPHRRTERVERDLLCEQRDVRGGMRPRADEVHVAAQDVDELRQLVEPEASPPFPHPPAPP